MTLGSPLVLLVLDWADAIRYALFLQPWGISEEVEAIGRRGDAFTKGKTYAFVHIFTEAG